MSDPRRHFSDHFDGTLSEEGRRELSAYLKADPRHAEEFIAIAFLHTRLREKFRGWNKSDSTLNDAQILPAITEDEADRTTGEVDVFAQAALNADRLVLRRRRFVPGLLKKSLPIAAGLLAALIGAGVWHWAANRPVATIVREVDARWITPGFAEGSRVRGEMQLQSGLAEIAFDPGASIVLEGPALVRIDSGAKVQLVYGKLTTNVPAAAVGFTVTTGGTSVVDLGTEVGIDARNDGPLHVEVFKGKAAVQVADGKGADAERKVLTESMAVAVDAGHIAEVPVTPLAFVRTGDVEGAADRVDASAGWRQFSARLRRDPSVVAYYPFDNAGEAPGQLVNRAATGGADLNGTIVGARWDAGRQAAHGALRFEGESDHVGINIPGSHKQLTVAQWVRLAGPQNSHADLLMASHSATSSAFHWQFITRGEPPMKLFLMTQIPETQAGWTMHAFPIGFDVVDDAWHFVAFSFDGGSRAIRVYVDGRCIGEQHEPNLSSLTIHAADVGNFRPNTRVYSEGMRGRMDEMVIWNRVVSEGELGAMYAAGSGK